MERMNKIISTLFLLLVVTSSWAQHQGKNLIISGQVLSKGKGVPFVNILVENAAKGTLTDDKGNYTLTVDHGDYTIVAQAIGYKIAKKKVHLDQNTTLNFDLKEDVLGLNQVVVSATKTSLNRKEAPVLVTVTGAQELQQIQATALIDGLNFQPGLRTENNCQNCGFSQIRINGLGGAYSQILVNSRPVFSSLNSIYGLEQIPTNMIQQIEVTRGGGSAIFGANAIAGTINIITKDPTTNGYQVGSRLGWIDGKSPESLLTFNSTNVSDDLNKGITFFGQYRTRKNYDANDDGFSEITKLDQLNFGFKSFYQISDRKRLTGEFNTIRAFRRGGDQVDLPATSVLIAEEIKSNIVGGGATYDYYSKNYKSKFSIYGNAQSTQSDNYYGADGDKNGYGITDDFTSVGGVQHNYKFDKFIKGSMTLTSGVEYNYNKITEDRINPNILDLNQETNTAGIFTQIDWKILKNLKLLTGVRGEYFESNLNNNKLFIINPRASVLYNITSDWSFRAGYAQGFRAPQFFSEDIHAEFITGEVRRVRLAENLKEEKSHSFIGSLEYSKDTENGQILVTVEGFYTRINNPFQYEDRGQDGNGLLFKEKINGETAIVNGANIEVKYSPNETLTFQLGGTAQNSYFAKYYNPEDGISTNKILRTPQIYGNAIMNYAPNEHWDFNLNGVFTGKMYTPHLEGFIPTTVLEETPSMFELGFNTSYTFNLDAKHQLQFTGGVKNIFNAYQDDFDRGTDRDAGYVYGPSQPRTIFLGIKFGTGL